MKSPIPLLLATYFVSSISSATVINIDFHDRAAALPVFSGQAGANDSAGGVSAYWNPLGISPSKTANAANLYDSTNIQTNVGFQLNGLHESVLDTNGDQESGGGYLDLMGDYVRVGSDSSGEVATANGKFTGLVVGGTYDLYFYGQGQYLSELGPPTATNLRGQNTLFTVDGVSQQTSWDGFEGGDGFLVEGIEFVKFTTVATDGGAEGGVISFAFSNVVETGDDANVTNDLVPNGNTTGNTGSRFGALNGVQLVCVVPEPSAALLAMVASIGLISRRRRQA